MPSPRQHRQQPVAGEVAGRGPAHGHQVGAVEGGQPGPLAQGDVQGGDVGVATERLGVVGDQREVEVGDQLHRPEPAGQALHHVDLGVGEHRLQVAGPRLGVAGDIGVAGLDAAGQLHPVAAGPPPLDPAQQVGAVLPGAGRRRHADAAPLGQPPAEPGRLDHSGHRPTPPAARAAAPLGGSSPIGPRGRFLDRVRSRTGTASEDGKRVHLDTDAARRRWLLAAGAGAGAGRRRPPPAASPSTATPGTADGRRPRPPSPAPPPPCRWSPPPRPRRLRSCPGAAASCSPATGWSASTACRTWTCSGPARPTWSPSGC